MYKPKENTWSIPTAGLIALGLMMVPWAFGQGSLIAPAPPSPTMRTLAQLEVRTPISSAPFTITEGGSYYLTTNLTISAGNAITIAASGVTLDLNGFTLRSTAAPAAGAAILIESGLRNLAILNGHIQGGVTNSGSAFAGPGFAHGIQTNNVAPRNVRVRGVNVVGCQWDGINLGQNSTVVDSCTVRTVGGTGIRADLIHNAVAQQCGGIALEGNIVANSTGVSVGNFQSYGLLTSVADNSRGSNVAGSALGLFSTVAQNCYGLSSSSYGLWATVVQNSFGVSSALYGLRATIALNSRGTSESSRGVEATSAQNCYGLSTSGIGLVAEQAAFCIGSRPGGTAIRAELANSCSAISSTNSIVHKYTMP